MTIVAIRTFDGMNPKRASRRQAEPGSQSAVWSRLDNHQLRAWRAPTRIIKRCGGVPGCLLGEVSAQLYTRADGAGWSSIGVPDQYHYQATVDHTQEIFWSFVAPTVVGVDPYTFTAVYSPLSGFTDPYPTLWAQNGTIPAAGTVRYAPGLEALFTQVAGTEEWTRQWDIAHDSNFFHAGIPIRRWNAGDDSWHLFGSNGVSGSGIRRRDDAGNWSGDGGWAPAWTLNGFSIPGGSHAWKLESELGRTVYTTPVYGVSGRNGWAWLALQTAAISANDDVKWEYPEGGVQEVVNHRFAYDGTRHRMWCSSYNPLSGVFELRYFDLVDAETDGVVPQTFNVSSELHEIMRLSHSNLEYFAMAYNPDFDWLVIACCPDQGTNETTHIYCFDCDPASLANPVPAWQWTGTFPGGFTGQAGMNIKPSSGRGRSAMSRECWIVCEYWGSLLKITFGE